MGANSQTSRTAKKNVAIATGAALVSAAAAGRAVGLPPNFVDATAVVIGLEADMRYAGAHNFTGAPVDGYDAPRCWLTRQAAFALGDVQRDLAARGFGLKVFDCYRPVRAVRRFVAWAKTPIGKTPVGKTPGDEIGKRAFYPGVPKGDLFRLGYIAARSSHSRGSTVDLTLVDLASGQDLDMGTPFDFFGAASHPDAAGFPREIVGRRALLRDAMQRRGFVGYDKEWWHFTLKNEPYPSTYFDVPIRDE